MSLVSPSQSNAGDTIEASDINNPINQLAAVINGGIDTTNIADNAISTVKIADNSVTAAKLSGSIPTPKIANSYVVNVYRTTAQTAAAGIDTKVQFDGKSLDISSQYDSVTNFRFTAGAGAGYYHIDAAVTVTVAAGDLYYATLYKNGTEVRRGNAAVSSGTAEATYTVSADLQLTSSDYIEVYFHNGSAATKAISGSNPKTYFNARFTP